MITNELIVIFVITGAAVFSVMLGIGICWMENRGSREEMEIERWLEGEKYDNNS